MNDKNESQLEGFVKSIEKARDMIYKNDFKPHPYIFTPKEIEALKQNGLIRNIDGKLVFNGKEVFEEKSVN